MMEEKVVAVIEPQSAQGEEELQSQVTDIELRAGRLVVADDSQYEEAGEFGVLLKQKIAEVTEFFSPMKKAAHEAHKQICDREKLMLEPLKKAEKIVKKTMGDYAMRKEQERIAAEEAARKLAQEEADRKLQAAISAEEEGDEIAAEMAMLDAEIADRAARSVVIEDESPKAKGVSYQKDWKIVAISPGNVPVEVNGVVIRPVDEAAVLKLIRASKGTIKIPGVAYDEIAKMSFRR